MNTLLHWATSPLLIICEMTESDMSPMIIKPVKNDLLKKAEAEDAVRRYMMREIYYPIRRAMIEGKHEFILERYFPMNNLPKKLHILIQMTKEKMSAITFSAEIGKQWSWFAFGDVGFFRITARW